MRGDQLGAEALGLGLRGLGCGDRLIDVGVGHQAGLELHLRDVGELAIDSGGLQRVLKLEGEAPGLEQRVGDIGDQGGARRLVGEAGVVEVRIGPAPRRRPAAPEVELPADVEADAEVLRRPGRREDLADLAGGRADLGALGAGPRALQLSGRQIGPVEGLRAHRRGLVQHRQGGTRVGRVGQSLAHQGVQLVVAIERPPVVERRRGQAVGIGTGRLIGGRRRHLGLADRRGHAAGRQQRSRRDQQDTFHADTEPDQTPAETRLCAPRGRIWG